MNNGLFKENGVIARREVLMALRKVPQARVYSGWRDSKEQRRLFENGLSKTLQSNHCRGLAVDVLNWNAVEKQLNEVGLINDISWDKNHFAWGGESQAATYPIIENSKAIDFIANPVKVSFYLNKDLLLLKEKIIKQICRTVSFCGESRWDLDWILETVDKSLDFTFLGTYTGIDWKGLMEYNKENEIAVFLYDPGHIKGLANFTGKFKGAIIQMPIKEWFLTDYFYFCLNHELCHSINWLVEKDLSKDKLDQMVIMVDTEEAKSEIVKQELLRLSEKNIKITIIEKLKKVIKLFETLLKK